MLNIQSLFALLVLAHDDQTCFKCKNDLGKRSEPSYT